MGCMPTTGSVANERGMKPRSGREVKGSGEDFFLEPRHLGGTTANSENNPTESGQPFAVVNGA